MRWWFSCFVALALHAALFLLPALRHASTEARVPIAVVEEPRPPEPQPEPQPQPQPQPQRHPQRHPQLQPQPQPQAEPEPEPERQPEPEPQPQPPPPPDDVVVEGVAGPVPGAGDGVTAGGDGAVALRAGSGGFARRLRSSFGGAAAVECPESARKIYVVDTQGRLVSFDPRAQLFEVVGRLGCMAAAPIEDWRADRATPYSMSVDRFGVAWVLYSSGELFQVSTSTALCRRAPWERGRGGFDLFGMGFVRDGSRDRLFIAGGSLGEMERGEGKLGVIDMDTLAANTVGRHRRGDHSPELSGSGGTLYAFYPGERVTKLDPRTAVAQEIWSLAGVGVRGQPRTWAFATFGGRFYLFVTEEWEGRKNRVYVLDPESGAAELLFSNTPFEVTGAGVSTCVSGRT